MTARRPGKKIVLIHPLGVNWTPGGPDMARLANIMPPIGLCSLAAWVEKQGHRALIHDCYAQPLAADALAERVRREAPDYVGFSTTTSSFLDGVRLAIRIRQGLPAVKIVFGGVHVSALRERLLREWPVIDYGIVGEGEATLLELLEHGHEAPGEIRGLVYRPGACAPAAVAADAEGAADAVAFTGFRQPIADLDTLPFPAYDKLAGYPEKYRLPIFSYPKTPNTTAISSRGCPYQCAYCDRSVFRRSFRFHSADYIFELIGHLRRRFGIRHINFYDDLFTFHRARVVELCERLAGARLGVTFNCAARAEHLDAGLLALMKRAGCWMISLGIESGDADLLRRHRSHIRLEPTRATLEMIHRAGIRTKGLFMMGLPGESEATIDRSIEFALGLPLDDFNLAKFTPFPGSPLYETIREHGEFDERWEAMNCLNFVFTPSGLSRERLEARYREFYRRYYERPRVLAGYLAMLWRSPDSWRRFLRHLGAFLAVRNDFSRGRHESRIDR